MRHANAVLLGVALFIVGSLAATAQGDVLYREVFGNDTGASQPIGYAGWNLYYDTDCKQQAAGDAWDVRINTGAGEDAGKPTNLPAVNSNPATSEMERGLWYMRNDGTGVNWLAWTDEVAGKGIVKSGLSEISWYQSDNFAANYRLALNIDGNWFFSGTTFSNAAGFPLATNGVKNSVSDFGSATWFNAYVSPGVTLDRDTDPQLLASLPNGTVQAVGLYGGDAQQSSGMRFDTFEIQGTAVPEPSVCVLMACGSLGLLIWGWRRRAK